MGP
ncbi:unnamed protein product, partial [Cuscuta europaea]|jgi:hypothetical protein